MVSHIIVAPVSYTHLDVYKRQVLYLCLEDGYRRLQDRLLDITEAPSENLYLAIHAGTLADGLAGQIETFVREHGGCR